MSYPLISIIIPCYNHGVYLPEAIASIKQQDYPAIEIVVVDDGSSDNTKEIVQHYAEINYIHQLNQGLSAARNTGIICSKGQYLVFLDADDWLLPGALKINAHYLRQNPALAFVSGGHEKVYVTRGFSKTYPQQVNDNHYCHLLRGNYISMIAAVMYQRWAFDNVVYDPSLRACEDYDVYLRIARFHPIAHHNQPIAAYRLHNTNMSNNIALIITTGQTVLKRQQPYLRNEAEKEAYAYGLSIWKKYYSMDLFMKLIISKKSTADELITLLIVRPDLLVRYFLHPLTARVKRLLRRW